MIVSEVISHPAFYVIFAVIITYFGTIFLTRKNFSNDTVNILIMTLIRKYMALDKAWKSKRREIVVEALIVMAQEEIQKTDWPQEKKDFYADINLLKMFIEPAVDNLFKQFGGPDGNKSA